MKSRLVFILIFIIGGCKTPSELKTYIILSENNKDVFVLTTLIQDHLRKTNASTLDLNEILKNDSLHRLSNNFESIKLEPRGGYISVYYNFSDSRDLNIELNRLEQENIKLIRWKEKKLNRQNDGEIQFEYGERFFQIRKIILKKENTVVNKG